MRIQFVINSAIVGGAEKHSFDLARKLGDRGHDCSVHGLAEADSRPPSFSYRLESSGPASGMVGQLSALWRRLKTSDPDLIVAVNQRSLMAATLAQAGQRRRPIAVIFHSTLLRNSREELWQRIYAPFFRMADALIYISDNQRRYWEGRGLKARQALTVRNGIDLDYFRRRPHQADLRSELGFTPEDFVIGYCAALRPEKNHPQYLQAIARLRSQGVRALGLVVGEGWRRADLEAYTAELGLTEAVRFVGRQDDVRPYVAAFDVGVICSTAIETLSLSALEIMAMGCPMVMSDIGGATEIITDGKEGGIFPKGDTDALIEHLMRLHEPKTLAAAAKAARAKVEADFNDSAMVLAYESTFEALRARP